MDARQHRFVEMRVEGGEPAGQSLFEDCREALAQIAVVALARDIDEAGDKAFERVAANEQRDALPLLQIEDADDRIEQLVLAALKQLVARQGVEDVYQRLAVVQLSATARGSYSRPPRPPSLIRPFSALPAAVRLEVYSSASHAGKTYVQPIQHISACGPGVHGIVLILEDSALEWVRAIKGRNVRGEKNALIEWEQGSAGSKSTAANNRRRTNNTTHALHCRIMRRATGLGKNNAQEGSARQT